ncbi:MAG: hypothetical protein AAFY15_05365, partial [Cyanobacteria bacterium J06648_11]
RSPERRSPAAPPSSVSFPSRPFAMSLPPRLTMRSSVAVPFSARPMTIASTGRQPTIASSASAAATLQTV